MSRFLLAVGLCLCCLSLDAQVLEPKKQPCSETLYRQFDFWLGDWEVFNPKGKEVGTNSLTKKEDGCLMQENWKSSSGGTGTSYNFYNKTKKQWTQVWVDNNGGSLFLTGGLQGKAMVLRSELQSGKKVDYYNRITWTPNDDGTVRQLWEVLDEDDNVLSVAFDGIYKKKAP